MLTSDAFEVLQERRPHVRRQHRDPIDPTFSIPDAQLAAIEVDVLIRSVRASSSRSPDSYSNSHTSRTGPSSGRSAPRRPRFSTIRPAIVRVGAP
jgi:hypothetical protein